MKNLLEYLKNKECRELGCALEFELKVTQRYEKNATRPNYAFLSGYYKDILDNLIKTIGIKHIKAIAYSMQELDEHIKRNTS